MNPPERPRHAFTVDVEDWFSATVVQETGKIWTPSRSVVEDCQLLLDLLLTHGSNATWFVLGEVSDCYPELIKTLSAAGQEIGIHGFHHHPISAFCPESFRESIRRAKDSVEQTTGKQVSGFRAVDFSLNQETWWALDVLLDLGFTYDASLFPMRTPRYGLPRAPLNPYFAPTANGRHILEIPLSVADFGPLRIPFAGGGYFRLLPFSTVKLLASRAARRGPIVFYFHPSETRTLCQLEDLSGLTRKEASLIRRAWTAENKGRSRGHAKICALLRWRKFDSIAKVFAAHLPSVN